MEICPDCKKAKISQTIILQKKYECLECPDCGGCLFEEVWYSAPKYPDTFNDWSEIISENRAGKCRKTHGVWKSAS